MQACKNERHGLAEVQFLRPAPRLVRKPQHSGADACALAAMSFLGEDSLDDCGPLAVGGFVEADEG